jgi:hypothetical protein
MAQKTFLERSGTKLQSDDRDFMLPMDWSQEIQQWCLDNDIQVEVVQHQIIIQSMFGVTLWRIPDEQQRAWFALRWS